MYFNSDVCVALIVLFHPSDERPSQVKVLEGNCAVLYVDENWTANNDFLEVRANFGITSITDPKFYKTISSVIAMKHCTLTIYENWDGSGRKITVQNSVELSKWNFDNKA